MEGCAIGDGDVTSRSHAHLPQPLPDARSGRVVFLSHCLLNQNTRYLGGAACPGVVIAAVERYVQDGTGIVQMPCAEQRAWGGVLKRRLLWVLSHGWVARAGPVLGGLATPYLRRRYAPRPWPRSLAGRAHPSRPLG